MNKFVLADMSIVRNKGIEYFDYSENWPVPEEEFQEFSRYMYYHYEKLIMNLDDNIFDIALIDYKFQGTLLQIFHYNYMKNYSLKNNVSILSGRDSSIYMNPDWSRMGMYYSLFKPHYGKLNRFLRKYVRNLLFNRSLSIKSILYALFSNNSVIAVGSNSRIKQSYTLKKEIICYHQDVIDVLDFNTDNISLVNSFHNEVMERVIIPYLKILKNHNSMFLEGINVSEIKTCWSNRFKELIPAYVNILNSNSNKKFLVNEIAHPLHRILIIGYQRIGCDVKGFHHGDDFAATILAQMHKGSMTHCKHLIVPTQGIANQYKKKYSYSKLEVKTGTKYHAVSTSLRLYKNKFDLKHKRQIKNVMLVGWPMNCVKSTDERGLFFFSKLHIEYNIIKILNKMGMNVLYKAHPDRKHEVLGVFNDLVHEVISDPFETNWTSADAFVFTYTSTTTFPFALSTDRKVVLIDLDNNLVDNELRKKLGRRVDYVPATINSGDTLVQFDERKLIKSLLSYEDTKSREGVD
jgi:hypothetical protein